LLLRCTLVKILANTAVFRQKSGLQPNPPLLCGNAWIWGKAGNKIHKISYIIIDKSTSSMVGFFQIHLRFSTAVLCKFEPTVWQSSAQNGIRGGWRIVEWIRTGLSNLLGTISVMFLIGFIVCQLRVNTAVLQEIRSPRKPVRTVWVQYCQNTTD
jgi:hypothetical protein